MVAFNRAARPEQPVGRRVQVVDVVVAELRAQDFISPGDHRHACAQHQEGQAGARRLALVECDATLVPAVVVVLAAVGRAVRPGLGVLLGVVEIQVVQREAVVRDHEVDRVPWLASIVAIQVRRSGESIGQFPRRHHRHAQLVLLLAQRVAENAVPFRPARGKAANLVGVAADGPRLGDQVDAGPACRRPRWQLGDDAVERIAAVGLVEVVAPVLAGVSEHRRQVEAEAIHAKTVAPVAERIDDQVLRDGVAGVVVAADAGVVPWVLEVIGQRVVRRVVESTPRHHVVDREPITAAPRATFAGVVVDHIDVDLDARVVEGLHHRFPFARRAARRLVRRIATIRREVIQRHVAPVVVAGVRIRVDIIGVVLRFLHRQEFDRGDAEAREIAGLECGAGIGTARCRRHAGVAHRQPAHMDFVDDVIFQCACGLGADRSRARCQHDALAGARAAVLVAIGRARGVDGAIGAGGCIRVLAELDRVRVDQQLVRVESVATGINISDEAGAAALGPAAAVRPVGSPRAIAVVDGAGDSISALQRRHRCGLRPDVGGGVFCQHVTH